MSGLNKALKLKKLSELAERIKRARIDSRLSQKELGEGVGVSDKSISAYEKGRSVPSFFKLKTIAKATKHPLIYFIEESKNKATLHQKLSVIEEDLAEIKRLLKKK